MKTAWISSFRKLIKSSMHPLKIMQKIILWHGENGHDKIVWGGKTGTYDYVWSILEEKNIYICRNKTNINFLMSEC